MPCWSPPRRHVVRLLRGGALCAGLAVVAAGCTAVPTRPQQVWRSLTDHDYPADPVGTPAFEAHLDRYTDSVARPFQAAHLLQNGDDAYPLMLALIDTARTRISMETYIVERDRSTEAFFAALARAAQRGVEVRFLADAQGFKRGMVAHLADLTDQGVHARIFNPMLFSWTVVRANNRDHRKILVVDGQHAVIGGINLSDEQTGNGVTGWRDTALLVSGPAAADAEAVFAETWNQAGRAYLGRDLPVIGLRDAKRALDEPFLQLYQRSLGDPPFDAPSYAPGAPFPQLPPPPVATTTTLPPATSPAVGPVNTLIDAVGTIANEITAPTTPAPADNAPPPWPTPAPYDYHTRDATVRVVSSRPDGRNSPTYDLMILGLSGAQRQVDIAMAYFVPPKALERALLGAARRGVRIRLLLPAETDVKLVREMGERLYGDLMRVGVEIYEWPYAILHAKTMVVDGEWLTVGSCNMDSRSFFLDYEANFAVTDRRLAAVAHATFEADLRHAQRLTMETWQNRGFKQRAIEVLTRPMAGQY